MGTRAVGDLLWQETLSHDTYTWEEANKYAKSLGEGWRVPTIQELLTLVDYERIDPACKEFPTTSSERFWSSTLFSYNQDCAWSVHFYGGDTYWEGKYTRALVRCVRSLG